MLLNHNPKPLEGIEMNRKTFAFAVLALTFALATPAVADPVCHAVHGRIEIVANEPTCGSAIYLCANAYLHGTIQAYTDFIGTSSVPTVDTPATGVVVLTGDNVFHTNDGDFYTKDAIVLATTGAGEFAEIDTIGRHRRVYRGHRLPHRDRHVRQRRRPRDLLRHHLPALSYNRRP
jgi:hypothetical protein